MCSPEAQVKDGVKASSGMSEIQIKGLTKVLPNMFVIFSPPLASRFARMPRLPRTSRECRVGLA